MQRYTKSLLALFFIVAFTLASANNPAYAAVRRDKPVHRVRLASQNQIIQQVPFVYQLGGGSAADRRLAEGCEESSILMAVGWSRGKSYSATEARDLIIQMSDYEQTRFGTFVDTSAADTAALMREYFGQDSNLRYDITVRDLKQTIAEGKIAIVHINGNRLHNPHYSVPGPDHHTLVVLGYDFDNNEFIVNDPGTRYGAGYRVPAATLQDALEDYATGIHQKNTLIRTSMIEISKTADVLTLR